MQSSINPSILKGFIYPYTRTSIRPLLSLLIVWIYEYIVHAYYSDDIVYPM